ncbi:hypothetical protein ACY1J9_001274 [Clostridium botulinum]
MNKENENKIIRKVFLDDLPKKDGIKQVIDWGNTIGKKVKFCYDNIQGEIEIMSYETKKSYLCIKYKDNILRIKSDHFKNCNIGRLLGVYTNNFKIKIGKILKDNKRNLVIINREIRKDKNNKNEKWYKYKCNKCGWDQGWINESNLLKHKKGCSCCSGKIIVQGINDIPTTAPWMVKYFQGGYDEAKLYTKISNKKIKPICTNCEKIKNKLISISNIYYNHSIGCVCDDGVSYSEKFMFKVLEQLNINFETELSKSNFDWCKNYRYDFYIPSLNCIIETHGLQHYKNCKGVWTRKLKEEQKNDKLKEQLAKKNGIEHYTIIDCRYSELEWIKNNILNSKLNELFDLSKIDWIKCEEFACSNLIKRVCKIKKRNPSLTCDNISKLTNLTATTINKYLKKGNKLKWCDYNPKEESRKGSRKGGRKCGKMNGKKVEIYKNNISLGIFKSCVELEMQSEKLFGVKLFRSNISAVCRNKYSKETYKEYLFRYV